MGPPPLLPPFSTAVTAMGWGTLLNATFSKRVVQQAEIINLQIGPRRWWLMISLGQVATEDSKSHPTCNLHNKLCKSQRRVWSMTVWTLNIESIFLHNDNMLLPVGQQPTPITSFFHFPCQPTWHCWVMCPGMLRIHWHPMIKHQTNILSESAYNAIISN